MVPKVKGRSSSLFKQQLNGNNSKHWRRPNPGPQCLIGFVVKMSRKCWKNVLKIPIDVPKMSWSKHFWDISVYLQATTTSNSKHTLWSQLGQVIIKNYHKTYDTQFYARALKKMIVIKRALDESGLNVTTHFWNVDKPIMKLTDHCQDS